MIDTRNTITRWNRRHTHKNILFNLFYFTWDAPGSAGLGRCEEVLMNMATEPPVCSLVCAPFFIGLLVHFGLWSLPLSVTPSPSDFPSPVRYFTGWCLFPCGSNNLADARCNADLDLPPSTAPGHHGSVDRPTVSTEQQSGRVLALIDSLICVLSDSSPTPHPRLFLLSLLLGLAYLSPQALGGRAGGGGGGG